MILNLWIVGKIRRPTQRNCPYIFLPFHRNTSWRSRSRGTPGLGRSECLLYLCNLPGMASGGWESIWGNIKVFLFWSQSTGGNQGCMEGGQSSNQLPSEDKRHLQGHSGAPHDFHSWGSGCPCDDPFPLPVANKMSR